MSTAYDILYALFCESGISENLEILLYEVPPFTTMDSKDIETFEKIVQKEIEDIFDDRLSKKGIERALTADNIEIVEPKELDEKDLTEDIVDKDFPTDAIAGKFSTRVKVKEDGNNI